MDEKLVLLLLTRVIRRLWEDANLRKRGDLEVAEDIAASCWDALILLLRQTLSTETRVELRDIGVFEDVGGKWSFQPAASLVEASTLKRSPAEARGDIAAQLVYFTENALRLLHRLPENVRVNAAPPGMFEMPLTASSYERSIADVIYELAQGMLRKADELARPEISQVALLPAAETSLSSFAGSEMLAKLLSERRRESELEGFAGQ